MTVGAVGARLQPKFALSLLDAGDNPFCLDVTIDTGFAGFLALPAAVLTHLAISPLGDAPVELADGSEIERPYYEVRVEWQGTLRPVRAIEMGDEPLVGINFLWGYRLTIDVVVGGPVTITALP